MSGIFINYRREDSGGEAAHLRDDLVERFGEDNVFLDLGDIVPGADYRRRIFDAIDSSNVVLVLIGPRWSTRRLEEPDDLLREEIARALTSGVPVVPVLVNNAHMPAWLPPEIQQLRHLQAAPLRNPDWRNDVARLVGRLQQFVPAAPPVPRDDIPLTRLVPWPVRILFVVFMVIFMVMFVAVVAFIVNGARTVLGG
jgi:TIR domain